MKISPSFFLKTEISIFCHGVPVRGAFRHCFQWRRTFFSSQFKKLCRKNDFSPLFRKKHFSLSRKTFFQRKVFFSTQLLVPSASLCQKIIFLTRGKASLVFSTRLRRSAPAPRYEKLVLRHL